MRSYDIFCKIVDNFGDIGVCWRLARQLEKEHGISVKLWIDDLNIARQLIPALDTAQSTQLVENITIAAWHDSSKFEHAADIVIEAFGCELPADYQALMQPENIWINLEYLSAESWVEGFHARNSKQDTLTRHFFFPGFTEATGGLLREHGLVEKNQNIASSRQLQSAFFGQLNLPAIADDAHLKVSLFSYPHAPISELLSAMADSGTATTCYVPATGILPKIAHFFGKDSVSAGDSLNRGSLSLHVLPFLSQPDYDSLLAICDINFVRGEDSWIRAIWAGKPFVWQPYWQTEATHITKLKAFLERYYAGCDQALKPVIDAMHYGWASGEIAPSAWQHYSINISRLKTFTSKRTRALAAQTDLATNLVIFIEKLQHNKI